MRTNLLKACGASIAVLSIGLSLVATPVAAAGGNWHGGHGGVGHVGGARHSGGMAHGGGWAGHHGGAWRGGHGVYAGGGWRGGHGGWGGYRNDGAAFGLGLLGGAIIGSHYPYYGPGYSDYGANYDAVPQGGEIAYCKSRFKSYDPASGTYLGYDGVRHPCP